MGNSTGEIIYWLGTKLITYHLTVCFHCDPNKIIFHLCSRVLSCAVTWLWVQVGGFLSRLITSCGLNKRRVKKLWLVSTYMELRLGRYQKLINLVHEMKRSVQHADVEKTIYIQPITLRIFTQSNLRIMILLCLAFCEWFIHDSTIESVGEWSFYYIFWRKKNSPSLWIVQCENRIRPVENTYLVFYYKCKRVHVVFVRKSFSIST